MQEDISHFEHEGKMQTKIHDGTTISSEIFDLVHKSLFALVHLKCLHMLSALLNVFFCNYRGQL